MFLAGNPNPRHQKPSKLVQSGYLMRLTTGENLVLISQTTFEKLKFEHFSFSIPSLVGQKTLFKNYFFTSIVTHFVPNLKAFGALDLDFLPKTSKTSNMHGRLKF